MSQGLKSAFGPLPQALEGKMGRVNPETEVVRGSESKIQGSPSIRVLNRKTSENLHRDLTGISKIRPGNAGIHRGWGKKIRAKKR